MASGHVTVVVSVDPEVSHRAGEAIRIALGLVASGSDVTLAFLGPAAKVLDPEVAEYVDGEDVVKHVTTLKNLGLPFHVDRAVIRDEAGWNAAGVRVVPLGRAELAHLIATSARILTF